MISEVTSIQSYKVMGETESDAAVEAWWDQFMRQKVIDDTIDNEIRLTWENCGQRRVKFAREVKRILELYRPIEKLAHSIIESDKLKRGDTLYREWGKMRRKECLLVYYDIDSFRATYTLQRFISSATSFLQALVYRILPETPAVEAYLRDHVTRTISVGVGPGPDLVAFLAYARSHGLQQRLVCYAVDQCPGWAAYLEALDTAWSLDQDVSVWFKHLRFGKREDVARLPDADMLVFSFANTSRMDGGIWRLLQARYPLIVVLDGVKEVLVDSFFEAGFKYFTLTEKTNVYYHFAAPSNSLLPTEQST